MKKLGIFKILFFVFIFNSLFSQEIPFHKEELKYDFESLYKRVSLHNFDVLNYKFNWKIDFDKKYITGNATIKARSIVNNLNKITLHLADNMKVKKIIQDNVLIEYIHNNNLIDIYLLRNYEKNEEFEIKIFYHGFPEGGLNFSYHQNTPIIWSLDEPIGARSWFPCYDAPDDKATVEMQITVPDYMVVASNGRLINYWTNNDGTATYVWKEDYPIATYLISISATNYEIFRDYYASENGTMEIAYFVYPEDMPFAQIDFSITPLMIEFFAQNFGEYPFIEEKYGMAEIPGSTAMEHQTCTSYPSSLITGDHQYDWIIAHELAHQWWGDSVTLADWPDIWLNEGFATYSDALWAEHLSGKEGLKSRMNDFKNIYFTRHTGVEHPIYDPPSGHLFCSIEYEKAAWVLHMLRFVVGESNFFKILREYAKKFAYSNANTEDFQLVCEKIYGEDLDWFFNEWIYGVGYPTFNFGWGLLNENKIRVIINQGQREFGIFQMPVEIRIVLPSKNVNKILWIDKEINIFDFRFDEKPLKVILDPNNWILCKIEEYYKSGKGRR